MTHEMTKARLPASVADAIREHLPEHVSIELRHRLDEADAALKDNALLEQALEKAINDLDEHKSLVRERNLIKKEWLELDEREKVVVMAENSLALHKAEHELKVAREGQLFVMDVCKTLVRNTEYRREVFATVPGENGTILNTGKTEISKSE